MKQKPYVYLFVLLAVSYIALVLLAPPDTATLQKYNISELHARLLNLTVVIPLVAIWLTALYGFIRFKKYSLVIADTKEGLPFTHLANGLMVLGFSLPVNSVLSNLLRHWSNSDPSILPTTIIIKNYVALGFALLAFMLIARGAKGLIGTFKSAPKKLAASNKFILAIITLSSLYTWLVILRPLGPDADLNYYYLPNWLIVFTIAVPYLFAWYHGAVAFHYLNLYRDRVKGVVYKQAFGSLAKGIGVVVFVSVLLQLLITASARLNRLDLTPVLLLVYLLLVLYAVGFGLVARGAKKLSKIEEV